MQRFLRPAVGLALAFGFIVAPAHALPLIHVTPSASAVVVDDELAVDLSVDGLTGPLGGFYMLFSFDGGVLEGQSYAIGAAFGDGFDLGFGFDPFAGAPLDLFYISSENTAALAAWQGSGFTLASVTFKVIGGSGESPLVVDALELYDAAGQLIAAQAGSAAVCVGPECGAVPAIPEPATIALLGSGLTGLVLRRRRRRATGEEDR